MERCINKIFHFDDDHYEVNKSSRDQSKDKMKENAKKLA